MTAPQVLIPWDRDEAINLDDAAHIADKSPSTIRAWAQAHHIGRRVGGGSWKISLPALLMFLDDDTDALAAYLAGDRSSEVFRAYSTRAHRISPPELR
ncbi:hypothetical protein OKC48_20785 [Methylorubrum extorquens]|uniref:hypothetical protein n=1 Tax=Methylorubrum extorquens TaxID=408 RepID=UPI002238D8B6|nr:hypothetical protein [Methylorubrum extorquens]UYW25684.1 hypothetical protein OKC48_20785 [Methylorubrum extorquens]